MMAKWWKKFWCKLSGGMATTASRGGGMKKLLNAIIRILFGRWIPRFSDNMLQKTAEGDA